MSETPKTPKKDCTDGVIDTKNPDGSCRFHCLHLVKGSLVRSERGCKRPEHERHHFIKVGVECCVCGFKSELAVLEGTQPDIATKLLVGKL